MDLRECLVGVSAFGYAPAAGNSQPAQRHLRDVRRELASLLPSGGYRVRVSGSAVNLPAVPWVAVLDPDVTTTARSGLYVVYLYSADLERAYLTVNQGATAHYDYWRERRVPGRTIRQLAVEALQTETEAIRSRLPHSLVGSGAPQVELGWPGFLPDAYQVASVAAIQYECRQMPDNSVLVADLSRFLQIYDAAVSVRSDLTATDPGRFPTPASRGPLGATDPGIELFKPKDASDYVARVAAQSQVKTRRHEGVVDAFGRHTQRCGWRPITNVHPRDMVLRKTDEREVLCEVKVVRANAEFAVREAIGQLITYRRFLYGVDSPRPRMLGVFSDEIGDAFVELLTELEIESVWSVPGGLWDGSEGARSMGLVNAH
jgi:hypothetical protein